VLSLQDLPIGMGIINSILGGVSASELFEVGNGFHQISDKNKLNRIKVEEQK
jgi:hypothetical protein